MEENILDFEDEKKVPSGKDTELMQDFMNDNNLTAEEIIYRVESSNPDAVLECVHETIVDEIKEEYEEIYKEKIEELEEENSELKEEIELLKEDSEALFKDAMELEKERDYYKDSLHKVVLSGVVLASGYGVYRVSKCVLSKIKNKKILIS